MFFLLGIFVVVVPILIWLYRERALNDFIYEYIFLICVTRNGDSTKGGVAKCNYGFYKRTLDFMYDDCNSKFTKSKRRLFILGTWYMFDY